MEASRQGDAAEEDMFVARAVLQARAHETSFFLSSKEWREALRSTRKRHPGSCP